MKCNEIINGNIVWEDRGKNIQIKQQFNQGNKSTFVRLWELRLKYELLKNSREICF